MTHCENTTEHQVHMQTANALMPTNSDIEIMANRFKAIAEPARLKILLALAGGELCVEHITEMVAGNQSAVSHQLKTLKDNQIIKCRRSGKQMIYSVADEHIMCMINLAKEHLHCHD